MPTLTVGARVRVRGITQVKGRGAPPSVTARTLNAPLALRGQLAAWHPPPPCGWGREGSTVLAGLPGKARCALRYAAALPLYVDSAFLRSRRLRL